MGTVRRGFSVGGWIIGLLICGVALAKETPPDPAALVAGRQQVAQKFPQEFTATTLARKVSSAKALMGRSTVEKDPMRYAMLVIAAEMCSQAGDVATAAVAIDRIASLYEVDALSLKWTLLETSPQAKPRDLCDAWARLIDECQSADQYERAFRAATNAETLARQLQDAALVNKLRVRLTETRTLAQEAARIQPALNTLKTKPADAAANLTVGRFYAARDRWEKALAHLSQVADTTIRNAAIADAKAPSDPKEQAAVGELWWNASLKSDKGPFSKRAGYWYARAVHRLEGAALKTAQTRMAAVGAVPPPVWGVRSSDPDVLKALQTLVAALYEKHGETTGHWDAARRQDDSPQSAAGLQWGGQTALVVYALVCAGEEPAQNAKLARAVEELTKMRIEGTYAVSYRIMALCALDPVRYREIIEKDVALLLAGMTAKGFVGYKAGERLEGRDDLSLGTSAWYALNDAARIGVKLPPAGWATIAEAVIKAQTPEGAWRYTPQSENPPTMAMTASALTILQMASKNLGVRENQIIKNASALGATWLDRQFKPAVLADANEMHRDGYGGLRLYTLMSIQRWALLSGRADLNATDWYAGACKSIAAVLNDNGNKHRLIDRVGGPAGATALHNAAFAVIFIGRGGVK